MYSFFLCECASPLFQGLSGAGSWCAESVTDATFSLHWGSLSAGDVLAAGTAFWLFSFFCYLFLFVVLLWGFFSRIFQNI